ncbi:MAG: response regulator [Gemmatimonadetes bacterium]|nr:MAG: response regulator [Gemmatimonadota bacterium]
MAGSSLPEGPRGRILVADDEPHIRRVLVTLLEASAYEVDAVCDGSAAIDRLRSERPYDIVLLDVMMPGATGLEVLGLLRRMDHRSDTPVVILTAKGQDADRTTALELGASDFVTKPFSPKKLLARIEELLHP